MGKRHESPTPRRNPSGEKVWQARWTDRTGQIRYGWKPDIPGTFKLKRDAAEAIALCYERDEQGPLMRSRVGGYFEGLGRKDAWLDRHPRMASSNRTNESYIRATLDIELEGVPFRAWQFDQLRRRHANMIRDHLLVEQRRAYTGVNGILSALSAMFEDAIEDEVAVLNPFRGMKKVRANDPRIVKDRRPVRVFTWQQMHDFARACAQAPGKPAMVQWRQQRAEALVRVLSDCGLRIGELFALCESDVVGDMLDIRWTWDWDGREFMPGTKTDHGQLDAGRTVPVPPALAAMLKAMPARLGPAVERGGREERLLFPNLRGWPWVYAEFHRSVWRPAQKVAGIDPRPHEMRHSWVSILRASGIDPADLADVAGHSVQMETAAYTHALRRSFDEIRRAVGSE